MARADAWEIIEQIVKIKKSTKKTHFSYFLINSKAWGD